MPLLEFAHLGKSFCYDLQNFFFFFTHFLPPSINHVVYYRHIIFHSIHFVNAFCVFWKLFVVKNIQSVYNMKKEIAGGWCIYE
nr:MAG TPA: hypothetical protein [Caudoviricetes sp.]